MMVTALLGVAGGCESWCRESCADLNGNDLTVECGGCTIDYACHPGAGDWPSFEDDADTWLRHDLQTAMTPAVHASSTASAVYELVPGQRVVVLPSSRWGQVLPNCSQWAPSYEFDLTPGGHEQDGPPPCLQCHFTGNDATTLFRNLMDEHADKLSQLIGKDAENTNLQCEHIHSYATWTVAKNDVPHRFHSDMPCALPDERDPDLHISVIAYPHNRWKASWGGRTEWASTECHATRSSWHPSFAATSTAPQTIEPALRLAPLPDRTVMFNGRLLHRFMSMRANAGYSRDDSPAGTRHSIVMRIRCRPNPNYKHTHELQAGMRAP